MSGIHSESFLDVNMMHIFMLPTRKGAEALCFRVVRPYGNLITAISGEALGDFYHTSSRGTHDK